MALYNSNLERKQAAILNSDIHASIKLPDTGSVTGSVLTTASAKYLRPGQGVVLGGNHFNITDIQGNQVKIDREFIDRNGNAASIDRGDVYTDGTLMRINNCAERSVFEIDATGVPITKNGIPRKVKTDEITFDDIRTGFVVVKNLPTTVLRYKSSDPSTSSKFGLEKLGPVGSLHTFILFNHSIADLDFDIGEPFGVVGSLARSIIGPNTMVRIFLYIEDPQVLRVFQNSFAPVF
jgi:hypothetical protein